MNVGDILNFAYKGSAQTATLEPGTYRLEVWGAQGGNGNGSTRYAGGKGGYAKGTLEITANTTVTIYVGGHGTGSSSYGVQGGGYNGGGAGGYSNGGSGGGGTDIRMGGTDLSNRIIVAGGGGGGGYRTGYSGGSGGGASGRNGAGYSTTYNAKGGTQTAGGAGGSYNGGNYKGAAGSFGQGGAAATSTTAKYGRSGGGGGGYYGGGGGGYRADSSYYYYGQSGGGGGSGYVASTLTDTSNIAGNASMPSTSGGTETGHSGDGYARITCLTLSGPSTPQNFRMTAKTYHSISLAWDASSRATGYRLYRNNTLISDQTGTTYQDSGLAPATSYSYKVVAYDATKESTAATLTASTKTVSPPDDFAVTGTDYTALTLTWTTADEDGFRIYRGGTLLADTTQGTFTDTGLLPDTSYTYAITAYVGSVESSEATATGKTDFAYYTAGPEFSDGHFTVNPVIINGQTVLQIMVEDTIRILKPSYRYSGELFAGEQ